MLRPTVVLALPPSEAEAVGAELREAGYATAVVQRPAELAALFDVGTDVAVAVLDGETDFDALLDYHVLLHEDGRAIPALIIVPAPMLERLLELTAATSSADEYMSRPYTAESVRWRIEAMCIRSQTPTGVAEGPIIEQGPVDPTVWRQRGRVVAVFNAKGGVGKTTIATNLAAALATRRSKKVLLVDADTVTGHVATSLGLDQVVTLADVWREGPPADPVRSLVEIAVPHESGSSVVSLTASPLGVEVLEPGRVAAAIDGARAHAEIVVVDLHPSYSPLNRAIFGVADRILVPVTPDVPALRAAVQLRDVADQLKVGGRLALVVNRANSGVSVADIERTVGLPAVACIRSGGLLFVRAANEGRTVVERYPREGVTEDFEALADRILGLPRPEPAKRSVFGLLGRSRSLAGRGATGAPARV
ncbi:MAG TPA: AAA family ATPase [Candidatus Binatia bacterium]|nr:AAA family ATPase [Candidatus Binatia bacterium]